MFRLSGGLYMLRGVWGERGRACVVQFGITLFEEAVVALLPQNVTASKID